ncbi:MAG: FAD-dependent oxidoreductase [Oscillatoria sp. SIO1A7]|nr:FAD-dependent oxidoreductase [Oscillatoria sp. SIO1A7]
MPNYDVIGFGDEVPGVLALVSAAREYRRQTKKEPRILLMSPGNLDLGIGGHLVRGGLAYLDRSQIKKELRDARRLDTFGAPGAIYKEFLQKAGVVAVGLDPRKADAVLREMLGSAGVSLLSQVEIDSITKDGRQITGITTSTGDVYYGRQFIDSTINAQLAIAAGAKKLKGFETFGLPESELAVTVVFETEGISAQKLKKIELAYLKRFGNPADAEARQALQRACGFDRQLAERVRRDMFDAKGNLKSLWIGSDYIDVRASALSIAYHAFRRKPFSLQQSRAILDKGNIAVLPGNRLSWNAPVFAVTGSEAEELAANGAKPNARMLEEIAFFQKWFESIGATSATPASELYIRHAGNVTGVVEPLSGAKMLAGGVLEREALGTFSYPFDVRGGIVGIGDKAAAKGFKTVSFPQPIFNIGIRHAQMKDIPNLAVVSPASGFRGYGCSAGRIVEFNAAVGQGLGIAAIAAILSDRNLADISNQEVRQVLESSGQLPPIFGIPQTEEASKLEQFEQALA